MGARTLQLAILAQAVIDVLVLDLGCGDQPLSSEAEQDVESALWLVLQYPTLRNRLKSEDKHRWLSELWEALYEDNFDEQSFDRRLQELLEVQYEESLG